jgi:anti-sigma-K factor RskA
MVHEDYQEMLVLQALTALCKQDENAVRQHLATCAECRSELDAWQATASALAYTAKPVEPPAQLRERILASVRAEGGTLRPMSANVIQLPRTSRRPAHPFLRFEAIAAAVIFVALSTGLVVLWQQNRAAKAELARLSIQIEETRKERDREHQALAVLMKPGVNATELTGMKDAPDARALLAFDQNSGKAILMAHGLPPAPAGKAYQLWFIAGGHPMPGRVFKIDASGQAMISDQVPAEARRSATFAVTLEPAAGVGAPTGPMFLRGQSL